MTKYESCRVALTESLAGLDPELLREILARLEQVPGDRSPDAYIQAMSAVITSVCEKWLAASKARTKELEQESAKWELQSGMLKLFGTKPLANINH